MIRWEPDNRTRIRSEPAPSDVRKATGIGPRHGKGSTRLRTEIGASGLSGKGPATGAAGLTPVPAASTDSPVGQVRIIEPAGEGGALAAMQPGQRLARGVMRHLADAYGFACLEEFSPTPGLRVDVAALGPKGEVWVVECKSCRADFVGDGKWRGYLDWCDRYFWAVDCDFPAELLPEETGLMIADAWGAEVVRPAPETRLAAARRRKLVQDFARCAAGRWMRASDPRL